MIEDAAFHNLSIRRFARFSGIVASMGLSRARSFGQGAFCGARFKPDCAGAQGNLQASRGYRRLG
jgi:hypothetical protein